MRFEYIVLLIIAFNVVTAVMQRRAKKAREAAARQGAPGGPVRESDEAWMEEEDEVVSAPRGRSTESAEDRRREQTMAAGSAPEPRSVERMPSLGRDILDQLARDLGLKIPRQEVPAPLPSGERPYEARPGEEPYRSTRSPEAREDAREVMLRKEKELEAEQVRAREKIREWEVLASSRSRTTERTSASTPSYRAPKPPALPARSTAAVVQTAGGAWRPDLRDPRRLREAFVVKEILDAPLARRPRR